MRVHHATAHASRPFTVSVPPLVTGELVRIARQAQAELHVIYDTGRHQELADLVRAEFTGGAYPQMLLRLGCGGTAVTSQRRPVSSMFLAESKPHVGAGTRAPPIRQVPEVPDGTPNEGTYSPSEIASPAAP